MDEIWKPINNYKNMYEVSNLGRVKSVRFNKERILIPFIRSGYFSVRLCNKGVMETIRIHRIVAQHFIHNPENKFFVNHIDANKLNNQVLNLEWVSPKENIRHAVGKDLFPKGEKHGRSKLTVWQVEEIRNSEESIRFLGEKYGVSPTNIRRIKQNKIWKGIG